MNRIYRVVWSRARKAWVVASELARVRGKGSGVGGSGSVKAPAHVRALAGSTSFLSSSILVVLSALGPPAHAADRHWDANATAVGSGGTGTWDLANLRWSDSTDGVSGPYNLWSNAALDRAIFGATAGTVTLGAPITVGGITFNTNGYVVAGGTLTFGGPTPTIAVNSGTATIGSVIAGTAGLTAAGPGTLFLQGANTFSGGITLGGGTLRVADDAALGALGNNITTTANAGFRIDSGSTNRTVTIGAGTTLTLSAAGTGSALFAGDGNLNVASGVTMSNDASTYTGTTRLNGASQASGNIFFTSVRNLGEASSLGAPTTVANGTITFAGGSQYTDRITYIGTGDSSNRNWVIVSGPTKRLVNQGSGTLSLTGDIAITGSASFESVSAGIDLFGVISGSPSSVSFSASAAGAITLGGANTYTGVTGIGGGVVIAPVLADAGLSSSLGAGSDISLGHAGVLRYTGAGDSSDRTWTSNGATSIRNDGTGALVLSGALSFTPAGPDSLTFGGAFTGTNTFSGVISGAGDLMSTGSGIWELSGANTRTGAISVAGGTLRAGGATAFGAVTGVTVNGGTLDLNGFDLATPTLAGTGGVVALGGANLTVDLGLGVSSAYGGSITGSGSLTKLGAGTLTLSGASSYTGATNLAGGTLRLDFSAAGAPASDVIAGASTLNMSGGTLNAIGADSVANTQTFAGLNITAGSNTLAATSGTGGGMTVNLGAINRTGGLMDFRLPGIGSLTTSNADMALGWATVNGTDYAKIEGGLILAFEDDDYTDQDEADLWLDNQFISDDDGDTDGFFGTVNSTVQLGGLRYTQPVASTVTVAPGQTLGVDGTIIVSPSVLDFDQLITGGMMAGAAGGQALGVQQNSEGNFEIASQIVDNGGSLGVTTSGVGLVTLSNAANSYTGATTVSEGTLSVTDIGDGNGPSGIGASSADSSNLVLQGATLQYTGATASSDRGFTLTRIGAIDSGTIEITQAGTDLTFSGEVVSPDGAGLNKIGPGTLTLASPDNSYTGATTVSGGTLAVTELADGGVNSSIGASSSDASNLVLSGGGFLHYTTAAPETSNRGFTLGTGGGGIGVSDSGAVLTLSGTAVGAGNLTKRGAGTLVLSGVNTYSGGTTVDEGFLRAGSTQAFGNVNALMTVNGGATLDLNGLDNRVGALAGSGDVALGSATLSTGAINGTFSGTISGSGGLTKLGGGTQTISGCNNDYTGVTNVNGGTLSVDCLANGGVTSGIGAATSDAGSLIFTGGRLRYTAAGVATSINRGFTLQSGRGFLDVNDSATTLEFTGDVVGAGTLRKEGAGTLVLSGTGNAHTGSTEVVGGILRAGSTNALGTGHMTLSNIAGVLLDLNDSNNTVTSLIGGGAVGGDIDLGTATLTINSVDTRTYAGAINGTGSLIKNGAGTQALSGCNSGYSGITTINAGVLQVSCMEDGGANSSIGASTADAGNLILNGGTLSYVGAGDDTNREFTLGTAGGALDASGTGAVNFTSTDAITLAGTDAPRTLTLTGTSTSDNRLAALIENNGVGETRVTKTGAGTWILTNPNSTYTGITTISGGVLGVDKLSDGGFASSIGASSSAAANLVIGNGSTLRYTGSGDTTNRLFTLSPGVTFIESSGTGSVVFTDTGPVTLSGNNQARTIALGGTNAGNNTLAGSIGNAGSGITTLAKNDSGTWVLTGNHTYTGSTNINAGTLLIGGGGTTGSIASGLLNNFGTLGFNRADTLTYGGSIVGTGAVNQLGAGTTILTGNNSYTGATTVSAGALWINGDQSAATGLTTVLSGATLGGTGTIGGGVTVAGGTLAPGNSPGTLTIAGDLTLDAASNLDFEFGESDVVGGPLNDLIDVGGNLVLDGTIDVAVSAGGTFDAGLYRVINYGGGLTNNGLDLGTMPPGSDVFVQTSIAGQVNLVNIAGITLNFWDGAAGPTFDDAINGGDGVWQNNGGNDFWTETTGGINAPYTDGAFAIFSAAPGTVTVDDSLGAVAAAGMQFASGGYVITGDSVELIGPQSVIRVGDGTVAGENMTATIASQLTGSSELVKTDLGTLILTGTNSYSGGTRLEAGTLQIAGNAALGNVSAGLSFDGGTLQTTATFTLARGVTLDGTGTFMTDSGTTLTLSGGVAGVGHFVKEGAGTLHLIGDGSHASGTTIAAGTLQIGVGSTAGSLTGDVINDGTLVFSRSDALTFDGVISGSGSMVKAGTNTLTLTANNTYAGVTTISGGTLQLGDGGASGGIFGDVANAGTLTFNRSDVHTYGGDVSGSGAVRQIGSGTTVLTGDSTYSGNTTVSAGELRLENGGSIIGTTLTTLSGANSQATVSGTGSILETGTLNVGVGAGSNGTLAIEAGGVVRATVGSFTDIGSTGGQSGTVIVSGAGSLLDTVGALRVGSPTSAQIGILDIRDGGAVASARGIIGFPFGGGTGTKSVTISGPGSRWTMDADLAFVGGSLSIVDGGGLSASTANVAATGTANILVSGAGSSYAIAGDQTVATGSGTGRVTLADGGLMSVGGLFRLANSAGATGVLNIGGAEGQAAAAAGVLDTATLLFGPGTGRINFNHTDAGYDFSTAVSGNGAINQLAGVTLLSGNSSAFTGAATVSGGTLLVNGTLGDATSTVDVVTGGILGGIGTIGGDVAIADGVLAPGASPGTLTIAGDLALAGASILDFEFGESSVVGGPLNDLVEVGGDLLLDGTINVTVSPGGAFDAGLYRIFNYGGTLTDNVLELGTLPAGSDVFVQTAVVNQVNLINTAGLTLNFWDGSAGTKNDGAIQGGSGTWRLGGGTNDWTAGDGALNADYAQDSFAIFAGAADTVTIDGIGGNVGVSGMQIAVDGYVVDGDALTLTGTSSIVRVGDGTAAGSGMTATIDAQLTGDATLVKTDLGTLVLTGANTYAGGTRIATGTLESSSDANLGDAAGDLSFDGGTLRNTASVVSARTVGFEAGGGTFETVADLTLSGVLGGTGELEKTGAGTLILTGAGTYGGGTTISAGTLQLGDGGTSGTITGDIVNNATLAVNRSDALTLGGVISGTGMFSQIGTGTTALTAENTYVGGTTISAGTLQLGDGGASGSVAGNVVNDGTLAFNRSDAYTFAGVISGGGAVRQAGGGTTILTGGNTYSGATTIETGSLLIDGDQSGATGLTSVQNGGALGGSGLIGGNVVVADGGVIAPGGPGDAPGMLTINGDLALGGGSILSFDFGQAGVVGGPLNDLLVVGGDLILDGTLNIAASAGGSFDPGLYRVIDYAGTLTDLGLNVGTIPSPDFFVQTSIANQVNLLNTAGLVLNFWDGGAGPKGDGTIQGGDGVWQSTAGNDNWTDAAGALNAPYADGEFAVFTGAAGTVTVDGSLGTVIASGMQFAVDGYVIEGESLTLSGAPTVIRVGDGTAGGAAMSATIRSVLTGSALDKSDLGTLVLAGMNTYTGGTTISAGTLQLGDGGASGSIEGDVQNEGLFAFNRSDTYIFDGLIAGSGGVNQIGTGTTVLTGNSTYAGPTTVQAGRLLFNGDLSGAAGLVSVESGGTLGGTGTLGGDVTADDGGAIAPGDASSAPGTLTLGGDLALAAGSTLSYDFGQANVVGGPLNDLLVVGGDLVLDGTLEITTTVGGSFSPGVYRVMSYAGSLADNGLDIGPPSAGLLVQTSIANQVNLVNTAGLNVNFWDGALGPKNDGLIDGGNGLWQNPIGNDNWTTETGSINAPFQDDAFAVFAGAPGTVTIDNSLGSVTASGLQFLVSGYAIEGGTLTLTGAPSVIRVGDGTAAGADMHATIRSAIVGASPLEIADLGTLVLTGENTYTGLTTISAGTLQLGDGGTSGSIIGDVVNGGILAFNRSDIYTFDGAISGSGAVEQAGAGTTILTGTHTYTGGTTIAAGILQVDGALSGPTTVNTGATLSGSGTVGSATTAAGSFVTPGSAAMPFGTLTLTGDYAGSGGVIFNTELGGSSSATSRLVIQGSTTGASSPVLINRAGGNGTQTTGDGIGLIQVDGESPAGSFQLAQSLQAGAFEYLLYQGGASDANDWFLRSELMERGSPGGGPPPVPAWRPGVAGYALGHQLDLEYGFTALGNLRARVGDQGRAIDADRAVRADGWMRLYRHDLDIGGARFEAQDVSMTALQFGTDILRHEAGTSDAHLGVMFHVGESSARFIDPDRAIAGLATSTGKVETEVKGAGVYWTHYSESGRYLDLSAQLLHYDNRYRDQTLAGSHQSGWGGTVAADMGAPFALGATGWQVEPQLQLAYQRLELDAFADDVSTVSKVDADGLRARASVQFFRAPREWLGLTEASPYVALGVQRDFEDTPDINVGGTAVRDPIPDTTADLSVGFTGSVQPGVELHFDMRYQQATTGERDGVRANFGFRMRF